MKILGECFGGKTKCADQKAPYVNNMFHLHIFEFELVQLPDQCYIPFSARFGPIRKLGLNSISIYIHREQFSIEAAIPANVFIIGFKNFFTPTGPDCKLHLCNSKATGENLAV